MQTSVRRERECQERLVEVLSALLREEDNKYCVDCDCKGPRWASWTLGIFLCIRCAGIHRNLGVHISRVKSVNLDSWTPQQVAMMKEIGNSRGRAIYEANLDDNFRRPQTDTTLEQFIRAKYEHKRYIAKEWIPPCPSADSIADEIRKLEQYSLQKKRVPNSHSVNNNIVVSRREVQSPALHSDKVQQEVNTTKTEQNNKVDLLGLDNVTNDDSFGDFVFAIQSTTTPSSQGNTQSAAVVSSAVDDLMGLNLGGNNNMRTDTTFASTGVTSSSSIQSAAATVPGNGTMDKNSILALYNNTSNLSMSQGPLSQGWPGVGLANYPSAMTTQQTTIDSYSMHQPQQYFGGSNWINNQPVQSQSTTASFGMQHNPFFSNNTLPTQHQATMQTPVPGQSAQQPSSILW